MDKVKVNNQIVSMRKFVKQARVHTLNKLTKQMKMLQNKKGTDAQVEKYKRKCSRLLEELSIIKKIKVDVISKLALSKSKDWKFVLQQKNASLEDRSFALIASYYSIQREVDTFHAAHPDLVPRISSLIQEWEERAVTPGKNKRKRIKKAISGSNTIPVNTKNMPSDSDSKQIIAEKSPTKCRFAKPTLKKNSVKTKKVRTPSNSNISGSVAVGSKSSIGSDSDDDHQRDHSDGPSVDDKKTRSRQTHDGSTAQASEEIDSESASSLNKIDSEEDVAVPNKIDSEDEAVSSNNVDSEEDSESPSEMDSEKDSESQNKIDLEEDSESSKIDSEEDRIHPNRNQIQTKQASSNSKTKSLKRKGNIKQETLNKKINLSTKSPSNTPKPCEKRIGNKTEFRFNSKNPEMAVAQLDLSDLKDCEEISVEEKPKSEIVSEMAKRKKDPFFLTDDGEAPSESDEEDVNGFYKTHGRPQKQFSHFNKFKKSGNSFRKDFNPAQTSRGNFYSEKNNFRDRQEAFRSKSKFGGSEFQDQRFKKDFTGTGECDEKLGNRRQRRSNMNSFATKNTHSGVKDKMYQQQNNDNLGNNKKFVKQDEKPLHPSWEAKKKLKESNSTGFQGKRTVFET